MLRDSYFGQLYIDTDTDIYGASSPRPVRRDYPVSFDPTESALASYITRQVAGILVEIQETPLRPFVEGEPLGTIGAYRIPPTTIHGIPQADFNRMSAEVWAAHNAKHGGHHRPYATYLTEGDVKYRFTWVPADESFHMEKLS